MDEIIEIITYLITYNIDLQINSMIQLCEENQSSHLCRNVTKNNYDEWYKYFRMNNYNHLFSKGLERLDTWKYLFQTSPSLYFLKEIIPQTFEENRVLNELIQKLIYLRENNKYIYFFIFSSLIIIFQVFGNGNHRTAQFFMKTMRHVNINEKQMKEINNLLNYNDYYVVKNNPIKEMSKLINSLINIAELK